MYECHLCDDFKLDLICASSASNDHETPIQKKIEHFCHWHVLTPLYYRKVGKDRYACDWCKKLLSVSGISYGCLDFQCSYNEVFFHESCLINMPTIISKHHFHPSHPLYIRTLNNNTCNACKGRLGYENRGYSCEKCNFYLHLSCVTLEPSLKLEGHEHDLTYFRKKGYTGTLPCTMCNKMIGDGIASEESVFYACVKCDFNLHFSCTSIPISTKHKYHGHELILTKSSLEDDSDEHHCDICEKERKPKDLVYFCKQCDYVAHIGCALNKFIDVQFDHGWTSSLVDTKKVTEQDDTTSFPAHLKEIDHFDHRHPLTFYEVIKQNERVVCKACCLQISDHQASAYACKSCGYYLHKTCSQLPYELLYSLHPHHSLKLFTTPTLLKFGCSECRDCSDDGFAYACCLCRFKLDMKCINNSWVPKDENQRLKEKEMRPPKFCLFNQTHELYFTNYLKSDKNIRYGDCSFCQKDLVGSCYDCFDCDYQLHERCLINGFPMEMQLQFHQLHPLYLLPYCKHRGKVSCSVCKCPLVNRVFRYSCKHCDLHFHPLCAEALMRVIKSKSHHHNLYYHGPYQPPISSFWTMKKCAECKESVETSFYFCMECGIALHTECARIPGLIKSKYHIHSLTLDYDFVEVEDDPEEEYFCDICEEKRRPKDGVYYCRECQGLFVAHSDCALVSSVQEAVWVKVQSLQKIVVPASIAYNWKLR
ncbi:hypothetical protein PTKIN_Ptkin06aG0175800 [Pterospermum kingtungense]